MTAQNKFYRPESEKDTQNGYADLFLLPMTEIYKDMKHCYIIELKYAKGKDSDEVVSRLREEGIAQANRDADTKVVRRNVRFTTLHKIVVVYRGWKWWFVRRLSECERKIKWWQDSLQPFVDDD